MILILLAQANGPPDWLSALGATGIIGVMLHWFMVRSEKRMQGVENASNRTTRAVLLLVVTLDHNPGVRYEAKRISEEIDEAEKGGRDT